MNRRSGIQVVLGLIGLVKTMIPFMLLAIFLGVLGYLASIFLTVLAGIGIAQIILQNLSGIKTLMILLIIFGFARGFLRYGEQACNHYIAFKLLAMIRDQVFQKLRELTPAKLETKEKGNLISMLTSDVELLEVFYAHTISPVMIALIVSMIMVIFLMQYHIMLGIVALLGYISVGVILPIYTTKIGKDTGTDERKQFGELNSYVLESIYGLKEIDQFDLGQDRLNQLVEKTNKLNTVSEKLKKIEGQSVALCDFVISVFSLGMFLISYYLYTKNQIGSQIIIISTMTMMSSFGPVTALSSLANNLLITFASGDRILSLLEEKPIIEEKITGVEEEYHDLQVKDLTFKYDQEIILSHFNYQVDRPKIIGIKGKSGSGKSTLLKLMMRFYDPTQGTLLMNQQDLKNWQTKALRVNQSYVEQSTYLFNGTLFENVRIAKVDATKEEVIEACKKANIHDFIISLDQGYDTLINEHSSLSGGQRQRIGLARAFLHDAKMILLDEPTSNLDSLNEALILKTLKENSQDKTIFLVSHRDSTLKICDEIKSMESERQS